MYICPECNKEFNTENEISKHLSFCWKNEHPNHKSKSAPQSEEIVTRNISEDMINFFNSFKRG